MQRTLPQSVLFNLRQTVERPLRWRKKHPSLRRYTWLATVLLLMVAWQGVVQFRLVESFLIPAPISVVERLIETITDGSLLRHTLTTLQAVVMGLLLGLSIGVGMGYLIARSPLLEDLFAPIIVTLQATPVVAYAPLLVIWFGTGIESKVITCTLIVFFPMLMNTVVGVRGVPQNLRDLMCVLRASWWQTLTRLELPAAMPVLLTGLKTSATLAVIGAVVGEFVYAQAGLGFMITRARTQYDTPLVFVGILALALMASSLYLLASLLERHLLAWKQHTKV
ncbi:MAG: ABC transporter permease [bacterium]|nr:ABC transporter permease [bacterium]